MRLARKIKRKEVLKIVGKCRKCENAYSEKKTKELCMECHKSEEFIHFKRRHFK